MRNVPIMALASVFALSLVAADFAEARGGGGMRGGGGGMRGGGGGFSGGGRSAATSIQRPSGGGFDRGSNVARSGNFNSNRNINANVNRNVNVNVDNGWNRGGGCWNCGGGFNHPVAAAAAIGTAAAVTAAAIGSVAYSLPPGCSPYSVYYNCGGVYYQPQYSGSDVTYVVVNNPG